MDLKPPANYSDPVDLEAIEVAKNTIGDYKLKDDPTYIAPEDERMNATKKRRQLLLLQNAINEMKTGFNNKLDELANLKQRLVKSIEETNRELTEISLTIGNDPNEELCIHPRRDEDVPLLALRDTYLSSSQRRRPFPLLPRLLRGGLRLRLGTEAGSAAAGNCQVRSKGCEIADEKAKVHSEIVLAELRFLMMLREFKLLAKLEMKDHDLNEKLRQRKEDMEAIDNEVDAQQKLLKAAEHDWKMPRRVSRSLHAASIRWWIQI